VEEVEEEDVDLASLPSDQLKVRLKRLGLPQSGKKADLVARLREAAAEEAAQEEGDEAVSEDDGLDSLSGAVLKERLKKLGLPVSGRKAELVARLREAASEGEEEVEAEDEVEEGDDDEEQEDEDLDSLRVDELKVRLKRLGLSMSGKKAELVARLREEGTEAVEEDEDEDDEEDEGEVQRAGGGSDWLKKGADVDVKHENVWYTCKVLDVQEGGELVTVLYYDGEDEEEGVEVSKRVRALRPTWVKEGMKVEVDSEEVFYECTVEKISSDWKYCTVKYTDGGEVEEDVDIRGRLRRPRPPWIGAGMRVEVEYEGDYYAGKVTKVSRDKSTCSVAYDAEDEEDEDDYVDVPGEEVDAGPHGDLEAILASLHGVLDQEGMNPDGMMFRVDIDLGEAGVIHGVPRHGRHAAVGGWSEPGDLDVPPDHPLLRREQPTQQPHHHHHHHWHLAQPHRPHHGHHPLDAGQLPHIAHAGGRQMAGGVEAGRGGL